MLECADIVVVTDTQLAPELTSVQLNALKERACEPRVMDCSDASNADSKACSTLPAFPAICHLPSSTCSPGVHSTDADFESLLGAHKSTS